MAYYFNPENADDLLLLHADVRDDTELSNVANATENDLRSLYTVYNDSTEEYDVKLRGYDDDPDDAEASFKKAYKQSIADAISWRLRNYDETGAVKRDKRGQREQEYFEGYSPEAIPERVTYRLTLYSTKEPLWSI